MTRRRESKGQRADKTQDSLQPVLSRRNLLLTGTSSLLLGLMSPTLGIAAQASPKKGERPTEKIQQRIDAALRVVDKDKLVSLALELCDIPNPLGQEERLGRFLHQRMEEEGLNARLQPFAPGRCNVLGVHKGSGGGRSLMFVGHTESGTREEFTKARIVEGEWVSGAGVWNMKGAIAAYMAAVSAVRKAGIDLAGDVLIAGVAGAHDQTVVDSRIKGGSIQGYSVGMVHLLAQGVVADVGVVGEPTSFKLVKRHFGMTAVRIDIGLKPTQPKTRNNLIVLDLPKSDVVGCTADIIHALRSWIPDYQRRHRLDTVPPWAHIAAVEGGTPWSPYPARDASIYVFAGTPPFTPSANVLEEIDAVLSEVSTKHEDLDLRAEIYFSEPGPFVSDDNPVVTGLQAAHRDVFGKAPDLAVVPWHSDASPMMRVGIPAVNYGPAGEVGPHRGEAVRIRDLYDCARVYTDLLVRICSESKNA